MTIAILAMQGAFLEHGQMLDRLGVEHFEIRKKEDLDRSFPKDQEELRDKVDEQLKELKKDGTLTELSQKYFGQDTAPEDDQFEKTPN